jgi:cell wall-associated NlpC family hydrolase
MTGSNNTGRKNPLQSVRDFVKNDPTVSRADTFSGVFQPATRPLEEPMTAGEQSYGSNDLFDQRMQQADDLGATASENAVQLAEKREQEMLRQRAKEITNAQQGNAYTGQGGSSAGFASSEQGDFEVDGNLSQSRQDVVRSAQSYAGTPYQLGGKTAQGIDCSGLVMAVYNQAGYDISQHSAGWQGRNIPGVRTSLDNLQPGDIVGWKDGSHIAIYAGDGMIIDASSSKGTSRRRLWAPESAVYGIKLRFPGD